MASAETIEDESLVISAPRAAESARRALGIGGRLPINELMYYQKTVRRRGTL